VDERGPREMLILSRGILGLCVVGNLGGVRGEEEGEGEEDFSYNGKV
jgi:hypothetical protein